MKKVMLLRLIFFQGGILVHRNICVTFQTQILNGIKTRETFCRLSAKTATCLSFKQTFFDYISIVKPTRCTISQIYFISEQHFTCFGRSLRPSSGI
jgi:hypothetical protein